MSLLKMSQGRQEPVVAFKRFTFADLLTADFVPVFDIPSDAVITKVELAVDVIFDGASTISVGQSDSVAAQIAATGAAAVGITAAAAAGRLNNAAYDNSLPIGLKPSVGMTVGSGSLLVEYVKPNKSSHSQG